MTAIDAFELEPVEIENQEEESVEHVFAQAAAQATEQCGIETYIRW